MLSDLAAIEADGALLEEREFARRAKAIDFIEFNLVDRIDLLPGAEQDAKLTTLRQSAVRVKRQLEEIDQRLFTRLRADIRSGALRGPALGVRIRECAGAEGGRTRTESGYDVLDAFVNGLLLFNPVPVGTRAPEPEMVPLQPTPVRVVLELVERARLTGDDTFFDLGSGLGQVVILVHLLSGAIARGVELEPAYCDYSRKCAADLGLSTVLFDDADARQAGFGDGTTFFMYTPFEGSILEEVLARIRDLARRRRIRVFTYGPCTVETARQDWLAGAGDVAPGDTYRLAEFRSR